MDALPVGQAFAIGRRRTTVRGRRRELAMRVAAVAVGEVAIVALFSGTDDAVAAHRGRTYTAAVRVAAAVTLRITARRPQRLRRAVGRAAVLVRRDVLTGLAR